MAVLVAGGGIGGLVCALSLHAAGIGSVVLESAPEIRPLGLGINLQPHAVRELIELGLGAELAGIGIATEELVYVDRFGEVIRREPCGRHRGYQWPQYSVHRGELQRVLLEAVVGRLGPQAVRTGVRVTDLRHSESGVRAEVEDRTTGTRRTLTGELLVGADGLNSTVRALLHPAEGAPHWSGTVMWRGTAAGEPFLTGRSMIHADDGDRVRLIAYPVHPPDGEGRPVVNWVCQVAVGDPGPLPESAGWDVEGHLDDVLRHARNWRIPWLNVPDLIARSPRILEYPMVDRDPLDVWGAGRVTLLGDAAHPMYPVGANGASQAVLDARVLAGHLAAAGDPVTARRGYEAERGAACRAIVLAAREMDRQERVATSAAAGRPAGDRSALARHYGDIYSSYRRSTGNEVRELNSRTSLTPSDATAPPRGAPQR